MLLGQLICRIVILFLSAAILAILLFFGSSEGFLGIHLALIIFFAIVLFPILWELYTHKFDPLNPKNLFILYYSLQLGIYPIYILAGGETFMPWLEPDEPYNQPFYLAAITLSAIGLLFFYLGYSLRIGRVIGNSLPTFSKWSNDRIKWVVMLGMFWGFGAAYRLIQSQGGLQTFLVSLGYWRSQGLIGNGYLIYPATGMLPTASLIFFIYFVKKYNNYLRLWVALLVFAFSLFPGILLGFRIVLVPPILQLIILWNYMYKQISWKKLLSFAGLLFFALTFYGLARHNIELGRQGLDIFSFQDFGVDTILKPLVVRTPGTEMVIQVMQQTNITHEYKYFFDSIFEALTILIPRAFWPDKQVSMIIFGREIMSDYLLWRDGTITESTGGLTPTVIGYFYWQMGVIGVLLGMFVIGLVAKIAYQYMCVNSKSPSRLLTYSVIMSAFPIFAESPQDAMNSSVIRFVGTSLFLFLLTFRLKLRA
ncbi:MAG: O-antigen polymerase [Cyanobacteria bacterium J06633_8]